MIEWLLGLSAWQQALVGTLFTWGMTALGAALVFFFKNINRNVLNLMLGFASGVMIAASFWSLLDPAIAAAESNGSIPWLVVSIGFGLGGLFLYIADKTIPHMHFGPNKEKEGFPSHLKRTILLVFPLRYTIFLKAWQLVWLLGQQVKQRIPPRRFWLQSLYH